jgi:hypothetical protein
VIPEFTPQKILRLDASDLDKPMLVRIVDLAEEIEGVQFPPFPLLYGCIRSIAA